MTRIGIAGHQDLPKAATDFIRQGIRDVLAQYDDVVGYSSLAAGADQLFAVEVLSRGGRLHAVVPSAGYETTLDGDAAELYVRLLAAASDTTQLAFPAPGEPAYEAAGQWIAEHSELLIAVWDGLPARGRGGTADTVAYARELDREVQVIWPDGMSRS
jgi:hypothetical protein